MEKPKSDWELAEEALAFLSKTYGSQMLQIHFDVIRENVAQAICDARRYGREHCPHRLAAEFSRTDNVDR